MQQITVVIIAKNESKNIRDCVLSCKQVTDKIIVVDSGSTDDTIAVAERAGARVVIKEWQGYGRTRNAGADEALNDWILNLDADERITEMLASSIKKLAAPDGKTIYGFKRTVFYKGQRIRFGEWGRDKVYRIYNRKYAAWNDAAVHEDIEGEGCRRELLEGTALHFTVANDVQDSEKVQKYARLSAKKYYKEGKKATLTKRFLAPVFSFLKTYILYFGFLDGKAGLEIALSITKYVWLKYRILHEMAE